MRIINTLIVAILFTFIACLSLFGDTVEKPYDFAAGNVISAAKMNANFDTLYNWANGNIDGANLKDDSGALFKVSGGLMAASTSNVGIGTLYPQVRFQIQYPRATGTGNITAVG